MGFVANMAKTNKTARSGLKSYLLIVASISLLWVSTVMSDQQNYPMSYVVQWHGIDTARYVVLQADTLLHAMLRSNGYYALSRSLNHDIKYLQIPVDSMAQSNPNRDTFTISINARSAILANNQRSNLMGISEVQSEKEMLHIRLAERHRKSFVPRLDKVDYVFAPQFGLAGAPHLQPDSVVLYGSRKSLDKITQVQALPTTVANISKSGYYRLALDSAAWQQYSDVRCSDAAVSLYIPVQRFTEKTFEVPLQVVGTEGTMKMNLYPSSVQLSAWVPVNEYDNLRVRDFYATVCYDGTSSDSVLRVRLEQYPSSVRVKNIEPKMVKYVIIK